MRTVRWIGLALVVVMGPAWAGQGRLTRTPSAEFQRVAQLAGTWSGTGLMDGQESAMTIDYRVTSGGSAVVETLFPGTDHEMVSIYHDEGGRLATTHYCALGNQPHLVLTESAPDHLTFTLAPDSGRDAAHEPHMHALTLAWPGPNQLTQTWISYQAGQPQPPDVFTLTRK